MPVLDIGRAAPRWRDGLIDLAVTYYGETEPAARLVEFSVAVVALCIH
jgi:hypothetical protein